MVSLSKGRLLITGADGFTGLHLRHQAQKLGFEVFSLDADLRDAASIKCTIAQIKPQYVIHLAGISSVNHEEIHEIYQINLLGTYNLLSALKEFSADVRSCILASSANVYGNVNGIVDEEHVCKPVSHYGASKLSMELMAKCFMDDLPMVIVRPFNYTGVGQSTNFVIPKIVEAFKRKASCIALGNIDILREFNDVRDIVNIYIELLSRAHPGGTYNICSSRLYSLNKIIEILTSISKHYLQVNVEKKYIRANEIRELGGDPRRLYSVIPNYNWRPLEETLGKMFNE